MELPIDDGQLIERLEIDPSAAFFMGAWWATLSLAVEFFVSLLDGRFIACLVCLGQLSKMKGDLFVSCISRVYVLSLR